MLPFPWPYRSLSTGRLTDLLLKAAFGTQAPDSGSTDSLPEKPMEISACGPGSRGPRRAAVPRQEGPEPLLSLSQRPLLASEGTWSPDPVLGGPAALPPWCSPWARPRVGPRRPRAPAPGCSQVRTVTGPLAGGTMLDPPDTSPYSAALGWSSFRGSGVLGLRAPQAESRHADRPPLPSLAFGLEGPTYRRWGARRGKASTTWSRREGM